MLYGGAGICLNKLFILGSPALQKTPTKGSQQDGAHGGANLVLIDVFKNSRQNRHYFIGCYWVAMTTYLNTKGGFY